MRSYKHTVMPMYTDYFCHVSPAELARMIIGDTVLQMDADGIPRQRLIDEKQGAWMVDKFRLEQFTQIGYGDDMEIILSPRREKGVRIYYTADVMAGGKLAARAQTSFFAVDFANRSIIRLAELEPMWLAPAEKGNNMEKAAFKGEMSSSGKIAVRYSDCDSNRHLTSPKYLDYICDATGYWAGEEQFCSLMQVDYVSECTPGEELEVLLAYEGERQYIRGVHPGGGTAFDAVCIYKEKQVDTVEKR